MNDWEIIFINKTVSQILLVGNSFERGYVILMKITVINFYSQLIFISACDMLWLSDDYLLILMLKVILSLVYHVISETYVQFLTITRIFRIENCKKISYCESSSNVKSKFIQTRCRNAFENVSLIWLPECTCMFLNLQKIIEDVFQNFYVSLGTNTSSLLKNPI